MPGGKRLHAQISVAEVCQLLDDDLIMLAARERKNGVRARRDAPL
jgi:hypothetical protein